MGGREHRSTGAQELDGTSGDAGDSGPGGTSGDTGVQEYESSILKCHFEYISEKHIKPISEEYIKID